MTMKQKFLNRITVKLNLIQNVKEGLLIKVPLVPECLSAQVHFECPSTLVRKCLECSGSQVTFECPSASSAQVPNVEVS